MFKDCGPILIADDDDAFRAYLRDLLERAGLRTCEAASGEEALERAEEEEPALALLDINMPEMNGYLVFQRLRERFGDLFPIIFISGVRTESYDRAGGFLVGADDYLVKPLDPEELLARVVRLLPKSRRSAHPAAAPDFNLTPREHEILELLVQGVGQQETASKLFISERTVAKHIQHILSKLGVHTRAQAVALAARTALVERD